MKFPGKIQNHGSDNISPTNLGKFSNRFKYLVDCISGRYDKRIVILLAISPSIADASSQPDVIIASLLRGLPAVAASNKQAGAIQVVTVNRVTP